jgi:hypothetical protein
MSGAATHTALSRRRALMVSGRREFREIAAKAFP